MREYAVIMLTGRELASLRKQLLDWFYQFQRDLPWRRTKDPYSIWISEIMLQQTRVAAVEDRAETDKTNPAIAFGEKRARGR